MASASSGCDRPANTMSRLCGPRSIQCPGCGLVMPASSASSSPGSTRSLVPLPSGISLLVLLLRTGNRERIRRHILRDRRSGGDPCSVSYFDWRDEGIVDPGPDVLADRRSTLGSPGLVGEVRSDRTGPDVRVFPDFGIADVRQVRHLRPWPDCGV